MNHCIIHQENFCTEVLGLADVMNDVITCVNYIRSRGLNHRQFKAFIAELDSDYSDVVYFSAVRWLSRAATLRRFWNLRKEIQSFMTSKQQDVGYLSNDDWLNDIAFLTDITQHLSDLNVKLQGKGQLVNKMFEHICSFEKKLKLFQSQLCRAALTQFPREKKTYQIWIVPNMPKVLASCVLNLGVDFLISGTMKWSSSSFLSHLM